MQRNPKDDSRRTIAVNEKTGKVLYKSDAMWPEPAASFTSNVRQRIIDKVGAKPIKSHNIEHFWKLAECYCLIYANELQREEIPKPPASKVRVARRAAINLRSAMEPLMGPIHSEPKIVLIGLLDGLVRHIDGELKPLPSKPKRHASHIFVGKMMRLFADAFDYKSSDAPDGHFVKFVMACCNETKGLPVKMSAESVQKHVKANRRPRRTSDNAT